MTGRALLLDDAFPLSLAAELRARGRPAVHVREADLGAASDAHLTTRAADAVLVVVAPRGDSVVRGTTKAPFDAPGVPLAVVVADSDARRREVVHRFAHEMASQRAAVRRYR